MADLRVVTLLSHDRRCAATSSEFHLEVASLLQLLTMLVGFTNIADIERKINVR